MRCCVQIKFRAPRVIVSVAASARQRGGLPNSLVEFHTGGTSSDTSASTRRNKTRMLRASGSTTRRARTSTTSPATPFRPSRSDGWLFYSGPTTTVWRPFWGGLCRTRGRAGRTRRATLVMRRRGRGGLVGNNVRGGGLSVILPSVGFDVGFAVLPALRADFRQGRVAWGLLMVSSAAMPSGLPSN